jgi:hypothetical protein
MNLILDFKIIPKIIFIIFAFSLSSCIHTKSGKINFNRNIEIMAVSGTVNVDISGHISENIYGFNKNIYNPNVQNKENIKNNTPEDLMPIVDQGKETINKKIILYEAQSFKYTLTTAEVVIMNIRSINNSDAKIIVSEHGRKKEYIIDGKNQIGRMISFIN